jgi:hypothetical protein
MQMAAHPTSDPGHHRGKIQKVGITIKGSIVWCFTSRSGHLCQDREGLHQLCLYLVHIGKDGRDLGLCYRCTSIRDGQDQLNVLITEATIQEMTVTEVSANNRKGEDTSRKIGSSRIPNRII